MGRKKKRNKRVDTGPERREPTRGAVLCPESTLAMIREFSKLWQRSMRITADDLIDLGRQHIHLWEIFADCRTEPSPSELRIAWLSPQQKRYVDYWSNHIGITIPLYQSFDELVQLGAAVWFTEHRTDEDLREAGLDVFAAAYRRFRKSS